MGFFLLWPHAFWIVQCTSHVSVANEKLPWGAESNILSHLDILIFLQTAEEHLHHLRVIFDQFREYNLKLKPSKCSFFQRWNHPIWHIESQRMGPPPQTYTEVCAFFSLIGHYRSFIKGFAHIAQPLSKYLAGEGTSRKSEWVSLTEDALKAFKALKQACMPAPILAFADYTKLFLHGDWCIQGWIGGSAVAEGGRWEVPPCCLWQQSPYTSQEELPLN